MGLDGAKVLDIAVGDDASGEAEAGVAGVFGEFRHRQVIGDAGSDGKPVLVGGGDGQQVGIIDLLDEVAGFLHQGPHECEALEVQRREVVEVDGGGDSSHDEVLDMGILAAENRDSLGGLALVVEHHLEDVGSTLEAQELELVAQVVKDRFLHLGIQILHAQRHAI